MARVTKASSALKSIVAGLANAAYTDHGMIRRNLLYLFDHLRTQQLASLAEVRTAEQMDRSALLRTPQFMGYERGILVITVKGPRRANCSAK